MKPTMLYKKGGPYRGAFGPCRGPQANDYSYHGVDSEEKRKELLADGWFETIEEAINTSIKVSPVAIDDGEDFRRFEELTDADKAEILLDDEDVGSKKTREKHNIHHLTLKKIKSELDEERAD
jgi:hypothetical protein